MDSSLKTPDPELLERESELLALDRALGEAIEGRGSVVAIEGPPGIGKSRLVSACQERAAERDMYSISVRATDGTGTLQEGIPSRPVPDGARGWHTVSVSVG